jgi:hypothetical protein
MTISGATIPDWPRVTASIDRISVRVLPSMFR